MKIKKYKNTEICIKTYIISKMDSVTTSINNNILVKVLEEIKNISSKIFEDQKQIVDKIIFLDERMLCIEKAIINIQVSPSSKMRMEI